MDERVRVRLDARGYAEEDLLHGPPRCQQLLEKREFLEAIHDHETHSPIERELQLLPGLAVPVEEDGVRREAGSLGDVILASRGDIDGEALLQDQLLHG